MEYTNDDEYYYPEEQDQQEEEEAHYRSLSFVGEAAASTSFGEYHEEEEPVYRSVSLAAPMPTNSFYEPPAANWGTYDAQSKTAPALAPPKLSRFASPTMKAVPQAAPNAVSSFANIEVSEPKELCVLYQLEQTHLVMSKPIQEIVEVVSQTLQEIGAVFEFKEKKHKFKCHLHSRSATISFHVRIFKQHATGQYIIEVQKRGGCSIQFCKIWRSVSNALTCSSTSAAAPLDAINAPSSVMQLGITTIRAAGEIRSALSPLLDMVRSGKIDLQRNALLSLDMLCYDANNAKDILAEEDALQYLCEAVADLSDNECRSRALSAIANLLTAAATHGITSKSEKHAVEVITPIMQILKQDTDIAFLNLHLQAVRALSCISAAAKSSRNILAESSCNALLESKVAQCSALAFADRSTGSLAEMQTQVAKNIAMCT